MLTRRCGIASPALVVALAVHAGVPSPARADGPRERVEATVSAVSAVLADVRSQGPANEMERKEQVRRVIHDAFDFSQMARDSLATIPESSRTRSSPDRR
jgi:ABC-type transporter MlaC component